MINKGPHNEEKVVSIQDRIFLLGYSWELLPIAAIGAIGVVTALSYTYSINSLRLKEGEIDFLNSSAVGPDWIRYLTYLGDEEFFITMIPFLMYFWEIPVGIVYAALISSTLFFSNWLKELFADSRPLWFAGGNLDAGTDGCSNEYGQPSAHSLMSVNMLYFPLMMFLVTQSWVKPWWKALGYFIFSILAGLVAWSRATLGVHFAYQIALGVSLGLVIMPATLHAIAIMWDRARNFGIRRQCLAAAVVLIFGNLLGILSQRSKPIDFDTWVNNCAVCEDDDLPDSHAAMDYTLGATGMLAVFPFIIGYYKTHNLYPTSVSSWPAWSVCVLCFVCTIIVAFAVNFFNGAIITIDAVYWRGILRYELAFGILAGILGLFMPMLFYRLGLLKDKSSSEEQNTDEEDMGL